MKRLALLSATVLSLAVGSAPEARAQGATQPGPWTSYGSSLYATGGDIWVKFFGADAGYTSGLFFICNLASSCEQYLFQNNAGVPSPQEVKISHVFAAGEEVIFKIAVSNTGSTWYTGPAWRNS